MAVSKRPKGNPSSPREAEVSRKLAIVLALLAVLGVSGIVAAVVASAESGSSTASVAAAEAAPPEWVQAIVSKQVQWCGSPTVERAVWVLADYAAAAKRVGQQPGPQSQRAYLVVVTAGTEFVCRNGFGPTGEPSRGKHIELLIDADTRITDTFGIGPEVANLDGLGRIYSYSVE
jgi:hypothetical protein